MKSLTAVALAAVIAVGCDPHAGQSEYEIVEGLVTAALGERKSRAERGYDDFGAVWLTQAGSPVMLVFGYSDDMLNCQIIRDAMVEGSTPRRTDYACIPVR